MDDADAWDDGAGGVPGGRARHALNLLLKLYLVLAAVMAAAGSLLVPEVTDVFLSVGTLAMVSASCAALPRDLHCAGMLAQFSLLVPAGGTALLLGRAIRPEVWMVGRLASFAVPLSMWQQLRNAGVPTLPMFSAVLLNVGFGSPFWLASLPEDGFQRPELSGAGRAAFAGLFLAGPLWTRWSRRRAEEAEAARERERSQMRWRSGAPGAAAGSAGSVCRRMAEALDEIIAERQAVAQDLLCLGFLCKKNWGLPEHMSVPPAVVEHFAMFLDGDWKLGGSRRAAAGGASRRQPGPARAGGADRPSQMADIMASQECRRRAVRREIGAADLADG